VEWWKEHGFTYEGVYIVSDKLYNNITKEYIKEKGLLNYYNTTNARLKISYDVSELL
jgi:hypothetical protein